MTVLTFVAGFSILFTERYPRDIFDFNVGVIRWTWRVSFYGMSAFGTDRYPPFSLRSDPDYPADFHVEYLARLSRGLVLVKWWLLAILQYLVVSVLVGGWGSNSAGVITILALLGAVVVAVTGSYPTQLFDALMGLNR